MSKDIENKSKGRKKYPLEAEEVAEILDVSTSLVKKVRRAEVSKISVDADNAKKIIIVDAIAQQNKSLLIKEIKKVVNL